MKQKQTRNIIIAVFMVAIVTISVAYATLSTALTITGNAKISANWKINFQEPSSGIIGLNPSTQGSAEIITSGLSATVANLQVEFAKPGDSATYIFDVVNGGTIDAQISSVVFPDMDALEANHLFYELSYETLTNGVIKINSDMSESMRNSMITKIQDDILKAGVLVDGKIQISEQGKRNLQIYVEFKNITNDEFNEKPNPISLALDTTILYSQSFYD